MNRFAKIAAGCAAAMLLSAGSAFAVNVNEVGAFLVYPIVTAQAGQETFLTVTNTGANSIYAHIAVIEGVGNASSPECAEFNRRLLLTGYDTETFVLYPHANGIRLDSLDSSFSFAVPVSLGFITINGEEFDEENQQDVKTVGDNYLMGSEIVVDYDFGYAYSVDAIPFEGIRVDDDREYNFDDNEYMSFPRRLAVEFIAPDGPGSDQEANPVTAELALFTLNFEHKFPPMTTCSLSAFDARENFISGSMMFGCWGLFDLADQPELAYPELGDATPDSHGWLTLNCRVQEGRLDPDDNDIADGGVHGAIVQTAKAGARLNRPGGPTLSGSAAWGRLLWQSTGNSDDTTLQLEEFSVFP